MSTRKYHDIDGNPTTLDRLCRTEPEWAANRIAELEREAVERDAALKSLGDATEHLTVVTRQLLNQQPQIWAVVERLREEVTAVRHDMAHAADAAERDGHDDTAEAYRIVVTRLDSALTAPTPEADDGE